MNHTWTDPITKYIIPIQQNQMNPYQNLLKETQPKSKATCDTWRNRHVKRTLKPSSRRRKNCLLVASQNRMVNPYPANVENMVSS